MSRIFSVTVTGHSDIDKALVKLPVQMQKHLVRNATNKAAKDVVLRTAKRLVPVDTGRLKSRLQVRDIRFGEIVRRTDFRLTLGGRDVIGSQVIAKGRHTDVAFDYASAVELGLKSRDYEPRRFLRYALFEKRFSTTIIFLRAMRKFLSLRQGVQTRGAR